MNKERFFGLLADWGCDVDGSLERFMDDQDLFITCIDSILTDPCFDELGDTLRANNLPAAFDCAHTLKGVIANMGLTPICEKINSIVEPLRAGSKEDIWPRYQELLGLKKKLNNFYKECQ